MKSAYPLVSGLVFGVVAVLQALRAVEQWPLQIGTMTVPVSASWVAALVAGGLSAWAFRSRTP